MIDPVLDVKMKSGIHQPQDLVFRMQIFSIGPDFELRSTSVIMSNGKVKRGIRLVLGVPVTAGIRNKPWLSKIVPGFRHGKYCRMLVFLL